MERYLNYFTILNGIVPLVLRAHRVQQAQIYLQEIEVREIKIRVEFTPARLVRFRRTFASKRMNFH